MVSVLIVPFKVAEVVVTEVGAEVVTTTAWDAVVAVPKFEVVRVVNVNPNVCNNKRSSSALESCNSATMSASLWPVARSLSTYSFKLIIRQTAFPLRALIVKPLKIFCPSVVKLRS